MSDDTMNKEEDISEEDLEKIIQDVAEEEKPANVTPLKAAPKSYETTTAVEKTTDKKGGQNLSLELSGVVNLKLNFSSGERSIEVVCTEDALLCRMADGTEFRIPTGINKKKQAA